MTYAFITDGLDPEAKERIDAALAGPDERRKLQARRERAAFAQLRGVANQGQGPR